MENLLTFRALIELNHLISSSGNGGVHGLPELLSAIEGVPGRTLAQKVKAVQAHLKRVDAAERTQVELRNLVERAQALFAITGPQAVKKDLALLSKLLDGTQSVTADEFIASLKFEPVKLAGVQRRRTSRAVDVRVLSEELTKASGDRASFDQLVADLTAARRFSLGEINEVANIFLGTKISFKTKKEAANVLKERQRDMAIGGAQLKNIEELPV
jgi:hypothetical protein